MSMLFVPLVAAVALFSAGTAVSLAQDLSIQVTNCPKSVKAGQSLGNSFRVVVGNEGDKKVKDVAVEIVLQKDSSCKPRRHGAVFSTSFFDGVLLQGGREMVSIDPGRTDVLTLHGMNTIPLDTPVGRTYFLCAFIDPGNKVKEVNETNNCSCCPVKIVGIEQRPEITGYGEDCIRKRSLLTIRGRNFGSMEGKKAFLQGSGISLDLQVVSWTDSVIVAQVPDDARIADGQRYFIGIRKTATGERLGNTGPLLTTCPLQAPSPVPRPEPPAPPFFHN